MSMSCHEHHEVWELLWQCQTWPQNIKDATEMPGYVLCEQFGLLGSRKHEPHFEGVSIVLITQYNSSFEVLTID